jgi:hypothetical protein
MEEPMNNTWGISILSGLFVYVVLAILLGIVDYIFPIMSDDTILMVCVAFGLAVAAIVKIRDYA